MPDLAEKPRFDWYAATVEIGPHELISSLSSALNAEPVEARGMHGYRQGFQLMREGSSCARVLCGGANPYPHAFASGEDSVEFARIVRANWPEHRVTRMDAAADFDGAGAWERITAVALQLADELGLKIGYAGDWHRGLEGRTIYVGSKKSAVFVRIYEKGLQLGAPHSRDWVRVEVVVRPDGDSKYTAARSSAVDAWGYAAWTRSLAGLLLDVEVDRVAITVRRAADDERAQRAMVEQYWRSLEHLAESRGGWAGAGLALGEIFTEMQRERRLKNG